MIQRIKCSQCGSGLVSRVVEPNGETADHIFTCMECAFTWKQVISIGPKCSHCGRIVPEPMIAVVAGPFSNDPNWDDN